MSEPLDSKNRNPSGIPSPLPIKPAAIECHEEPLFYVLLVLEKPVMCPIGSEHPIKNHCEVLCARVEHRVS